MRIEYGGIEFHGKGYRARPGETRIYGIARDGLDDFFTASSWGGDDESRPSAPGDFALPVRGEGKRRVLVGWALAESWLELEHMGEQLRALGGKYRDLVVDSGQSRRSTTAVVRSVDFNPNARAHHPYRARFRVDWKCPDPWWSGEERSVSVPSGGSAVVVNRGTVPVWPRVRVFGPRVATYTLSAAGYSLSVAGGVASGQWHDVDMETGAVVTSTGVELQELVTGIPLVLPVGESEVVLSGSGSGAATVTVADKYL